MLPTPRHGLEHHLTLLYSLVLSKATSAILGERCALQSLVAHFRCETLLWRDKKPIQKLSSLAVLSLLHFALMSACSCAGACKKGQSSPCLVYFSYHSAHEKVHWLQWDFMQVWWVPCGTTTFIFACYLAEEGAARDICTSELG